MFTFPMRSGNRGFTLLEMAVVLVIAGLMVGMVTRSQQSTVAPSACYNETQKQIGVIREAMDAFVAKNQRYPVPAGRALGAKDVKFGRETVLPGDLANIDRVTGTHAVLYGALPFQALGLPESYAADCWGNKFTYAVTEKMVTSSASGGYLDSTTLGGITLQSSVGVKIADAAASPSTGVGYVVLSHGENGANMGAAPKNFAAANPNHKWCTLGSALDTENCELSNNTIMAAMFNNGKSAGASYFDDIVLSGGKTSASVAEGGPVYCWGRGSLGNGKTDSQVPVRVYFPTGVTGFMDIAAGGNSSCALANNGNMYCWGADAPWGASGGTRAYPTTITRGSVEIAKIFAGQDSYCALDKDGNAYCLSGGSLPAGAWTMPVGVKFTSMAVNSASQCAVGTDGWGYCRGWNGAGEVGDGTTTPRANPVAILRGDIPVGVTISKIVASGSAFCALASNGNSYCWGSNGGHFGNGTGTDSYTPKLTTKPGVVTSFTDVTGSSGATCWLGNDTNLYCSGSDMYSQTAGAGGGTIYTPALANPTTSGVKLTKLYSDPGAERICGLGTDKQSYCWGNNYVGDGTANTRGAPTAAYGNYTFSKMSGEENVVCALSDKTTTEMVAGRVFCWGRNQGPACGGQNGESQPIQEVMLPMGLKFKEVSGGALYNACALSEAGDAYCWGGEQGMRGNGTKAWGGNATPTLVNMPPGVKFTKIKVAAYHVCAIGNNQRVYCWGGEMGIINGPTDTNLNAHGEIGDGTMGAMRLEPTLIDTSGIPVNTFTDLALSNWSGTSCGLATNGKVYCWGSDLYGGLGQTAVPYSQAKAVPVDLPAGNTYSQLTGETHGNTFCVRGSNNAEYCWGSNGDSNTGIYGTINSTGADFPSTSERRWTYTPFLTPLPNFANYKVQAEVNCGYDGASAAQCTTNVYYHSTATAGDISAINALVARGDWVVGYNHMAALNSAGKIYHWRTRGYDFYNFSDRYGATATPTELDPAGVAGFGIAKFKKIAGGGYEVYGIAN